MSTKKLYAIIGILVLLLAFSSYKYFDAHKDYEKYKSRYKELSILYLNEIMEPPKLEAPSPQDMEITNIDFNTNVLQFSNLDGNIFSIQDFKGKNLFINYWATWCNPCLAEMPSMAELYERFKDNKDIAFLYLSREELNTIKEYIPNDESLQKIPIYKVLTDDEFFATSGIPTTFIINSNGEVVVKDIGSAFWNDESVVQFINDLVRNNEI
jgi:thiol-disulfide isomerase/thioredoxin